MRFWFLASFVESRKQLDAGIELTSKLYEKNTKRTGRFCSISETRLILICKMWEMICDVISNCGKVCSKSKIFRLWNWLVKRKKTGKTCKMRGEKPEKRANKFANRWWFRFLKFRWGSGAGRMVWRRQTRWLAGFIEERMGLRFNNLRCFLNKEI